MLPTLKDRDGKLIENWYIACLSKELPRERPIQRTVYDLPFVLFRDEKGQPVCLPDRCLHRHARLSKGVVIEGHIACPYHGWMYNSSGQVTHVPSEGLRSSCSSVGRGGSRLAGRQKAERMVAPRQPRIW